MKQKIHEEIRTSIFYKFDENYKPKDQRHSTNTKQQKNEENHTKALKNQIVEK